MKSKLLSSLSLFLLLGFSAFSQTDLANKVWVLTQINNQPIQKFKQLQNEAQISFNVSKKMFNGNGGCNNFSGSYTYHGNGKIRFGAILTTHMACPDMQLEGLLTNVIAKTSQYRIKNNRLSFYNPQNQIIAQFFARPKKETEKEMVGGDNAKTSLDWNGVYSNAEKILRLDLDGNYSLEQKNAAGIIDRNDGKFTWNSAGNTIHLANNQLYYFVGENRLYALDKTGKKLNNALQKNFGLIKVNQDLSNKYWKLVELNGKKVTPIEGSRAELHILLKLDGKTVSGNGGCNSFKGTYEASPNNRIQFSKMLATLMTCPAMEQETEFMEVLQKADSYSTNGETLQLFRARMAPLAKFEVVYFR